MPSNPSRNWRTNLSNLIVVCLLATLAPSLSAQTTGTLTGKVTDASGAVVANVTVTATSVDTGQARTATTGTDGTYKLDLLPPGNYRVRFEAAGFEVMEIPSTAVNENKTVLLDWKLDASEQTTSAPTPTPKDNLPNAPSSSTKAPSLEDLGFTPAQTQGSLQDQARLDKRTHMLKIHQRLGLITLAPL